MWTPTLLETVVFFVIVLVQVANLAPLLAQANLLQEAAPVLGHPGHRGDLVALMVLKAVGITVKALQKQHRGPAVLSVATRAHARPACASMSGSVLPAPSHR